MTTQHPLLPDEMIRTKKDAISRISKYLDWIADTDGDWLNPDLEAYVKFLKQQSELSDATRAAYLGTVKEAYRELLERDDFGDIVESFLSPDLGQYIRIIHENLAETVAQVRLTYKRKNNTRHLTQDEIQELFDALPLTNLEQLRNHIVLGLAIFTGMSEVEIASIKQDQLDMSDPELVKITIPSVGDNKLNREVVVLDHLFYRPGWMWSFLSRWIDWSQDQRGDNQHLFCSFFRGGKKARVWPLHPNAIHEVMRNALKQTDLPAYTIQDLRRTFARRLYDNGNQVDEIALLLGYTEKTAESYIGLPEVERILGSNTRGNGNMLLNKLQEYRR
jgi:integrase